MRPISVCIPVAVTTALAAPVSRRRAAENHVVAVTESRLSDYRSDVFRHGQALACERGLRCLQRSRMNHARVSRNGVALFDEDNVTAARALQPEHSAVGHSRITVASSADILRNAATADSARDSWMKPMIALSSTTARMAIAS